MKNETLEKCVPSLPLKGNRYSHFYNDQEKFRTVFTQKNFAFIYDANSQRKPISVCLPTKIGSTNWLKALASLIKDEGHYHPGQMNQKDIWGTVERFPKEVKEVIEYRRGRAPEDGYMTFIPVRHPFARLYSAWKDKFRKGHLWLKHIEKSWGEYLRDFETQNMEKEVYQYSFEAFLELVAVSGIWVCLNSYYLNHNFSLIIIFRERALIKKWIFTETSTGSPSNSIGKLQVELDGLFRT